MILKAAAVVAAVGCKLMEMANRCIRTTCRPPLLPFLMMLEKDLQATVMVVMLMMVVMVVMVVMMMMMQMMMAMTMMMTMMMMVEAEAS